MKFINIIIPFKIACETVVDLADSKPVCVPYFNISFSLFPAIWMCLLKELSVAHMVFKNNLFFS